ncbi:MAG: hypothetical protein LBO20_10575 [Bifidobacteriaceae bacterium]|nr:hypothetical protein [Bifidobacteriaceae bacterium]
MTADADFAKRAAPFALKVDVPEPQIDISASNGASDETTDGHASRSL